MSNKITLEMMVETLKGSFDAYKIILYTIEFETKLSIRQSLPYQSIVIF